MRRGTLSAAVVVAGMLAMTGSAQAKAQPRAVPILTGVKPVQIGSPQQVGTPAVAEDNNGNAVIAWADTSSSPDTVQYCVVSYSSKTCGQQGTLTPAAAQNVDNVQVFVEGPGDSPTYVILADVFAATGDSPQRYAPEQEWQSTDHGATWVAQAQGLSIADGILNADTVPVNGVSGPGTGELGYGWDTASGVPTFQAFPVQNPPACGATNEPLPCDGGSFATLEPSTNPDVLGNAPGRFAAQSGTSPGVLGVFDTNFTSGPLGCPNHFGTAFVYGSGVESPTNDYNVSPGQPGSAWKNALTQADCGTEYSTAGGGPSGFGILEENLDSRSVIYHAFSATADGFTSPPVTVNSTTGDFEPTLSQDSEGGIFAVYFTDAGGPVEFSYSGTQGRSFATTQLDPDSDGMEANLASAVNLASPGGSVGYAVWTDNENVYELPFQAAAVAVPATIPPTATATPPQASLPVGCASVPCTVSVTMSAPVTVVSGVARVGYARRVRTLTLGHGRATLITHAHGKLVVRFSAKAKRALRAAHGAVKVSASVSTRIQGVTVKRTQKLRLTVRGR